MAAGEPERAGGLHLALVDRFDRGADDLGEIGRDVQREREPSREEAALDVERGHELRQRVVNEKELHQKRRAAEKEDVGAADPADYRIAGDLAQREKDAENERGGNGEHRERERRAGGLDQGGHPANNLLDCIHHGVFISSISRQRPCAQSL